MQGQRQQQIASHFGANLSTIEHQTFRDADWPFVFHTCVKLPPKLPLLLLAHIITHSLQNCEKSTVQGWYSGIPSANRSTSDSDTLFACMALYDSTFPKQNSNGSGEGSFLLMSPVSLFRPNDRRCVNRCCGGTLRRHLHCWDRQI